MPIRNLVVVLGDQLDHESAAFDAFDPQSDAIWMAEVAEETEHVWCHQQRIAFFFAAMRHFRDHLTARGWPVRYHQLSAEAGSDAGHSLAAVLSIALRADRPQRLLMVSPGEHRVRESLEDVAREFQVPLEYREDRHFYCTPAEFAEFARGRKSLLMEHFYRRLRKRHQVLMDGEAPVGGRWNFDQENRRGFPRTGPGPVPSPLPPPQDPTTREVLKLVAERFAEHPGRLDRFSLPVTRGGALEMLDRFVRWALPAFGTYQDAMWHDAPFLYHSRLSALLNVKLLSPRECVERAAAAYHAGEAPLNAVEGFVRQLLGWREFVRGVYWLLMPQYAERNEFQHARDLPDFYWTGETDLECVRQSMAHVLDHGYAHHIHRLMVLGNLALLLGVDPWQFHQWHMAMYLDAVDWVSLPNTLGMSQHADGGVVGTKPYISSGNYISRMSPFCKQCRFDPKRAVGPQACPFTTLYWDFLQRHETPLRGNPRMGMQMKNLDRKADPELAAIQAAARRTIRQLTGQG